MANWKLLRKKLPNSVSMFILYCHSYEMTEENHGRQSWKPVPQLGTLWIYLEYYCYTSVLSSTYNGINKVTVVMETGCDLFAVGTKLLKYYLDKLCASRVNVYYRHNTDIYNSTKNQENYCVYCCLSVFSICWHVVVISRWPFHFCCDMAHTAIQSHHNTERFNVSILAIIIGQHPAGGQV